METPKAQIHKVLRAAAAAVEEEEEQQQQQGGGGGEEMQRAMLERVHEQDAVAVSGVRMISSAADSSEKPQEEEEPKLSARCGPGTGRASWREWVEVAGNTRKIDVEDEVKKRLRVVGEGEEEVSCKGSCGVGEKVEEETKEREAEEMKREKEKRAAERRAAFLAQEAPEETCRPQRATSVSTSDSNKDALLAPEALEHADQDGHMPTSDSSKMQSRQGSLALAAPGEEGEPAGEEEARGERCGEAKGRDYLRRSSGRAGSSDAADALRRLSVCVCMCVCVCVRV
jgi:hypothetical protein